jgi:hypothetical protein
VRRVSTVIAVISFLVLPLAARASPVPRGWHAPRAWLADALCIHQHEGAWPDDTGNGYYGGMQFLESTWQSVGAPGYPNDYPPRVQLFYAYKVWKRDGGSWSEWGTAGMCGLT